MAKWHFGNNTNVKLKDKPIELFELKTRVIHTFIFIFHILFLFFARHIDELKKINRQKQSKSSKQKYGRKGNAKDIKILNQIGKPNDVVVDD